VLAAASPLSYKYTMGTTVGAAYDSWTTKLGTITSTFGRFYFRVTSLPTTTARIFKFLSGTTVCCELVLQSGTNQVGLKNTAGTDTGTGAAGAIAINTVYRIEFSVTFSTTAGTATWKKYLGNSLTTTGADGTASAANFGAASANVVQHGVVSGYLASQSLWMGGINLNATGFPGPLAGTAAARPPQRRDVRSRSGRGGSAMFGMYGWHRRRSGLLVAT
jgi:hypothetical protein